LGGFKPYWEVESPSRPKLKLFEISAGTGVVDVEIVSDFCQTNLNLEKVMIVDAMTQVWVWFGSSARVTEEKYALDTAIKYADQSKGPNSPVILTKAHQEPDSFKRLFHAWVVNAKVPKGVTGVFEQDARHAFKDYTQKIFTFEQLTQKVLPKGVDPTIKETYLADDEFKEIFGMTKEEYSKKPKWKTEDMKKKAGLY